LLKRAARLASATARPTALHTPWPRGPACVRARGEGCSKVSRWHDGADGAACRCLRPSSLRCAYAWKLGGAAAAAAAAATAPDAAATAPAAAPQEDPARTGGHLHAVGDEVLGVTGGLAVPLAEALQVVHLHQGEGRGGGGAGGVTARLLARGAACLHAAATCWVLQAREATWRCCACCWTGALKSSKQQRCVGLGKREPVGAVLGCTACMLISTAC